MDRFIFYWKTSCWEDRRLLKGRSSRLRLRRKDKSLAALSKSMSIVITSNCHHMASEQLSIYNIITKMLKTRLCNYPSASFCVCCSARQSANPLLLPVRNFIEICPTSQSSIVPSLLLLVSPDWN